MKGDILVYTILLLRLFVEINTEATVLTYIVERETNQEDHYVEITLKIQVDGYSLKESIDTAENVIKNIKQAVIQDCEANSADKQAKKQCKDIVDASKYDIEPKYHMVRKVPTFTLFILTHEVTIKIKNIKGLGKITDLIQQIGQDIATLKQFVWKTDQEVDPQISTLKDGLVQGRQLCQKIGKVLEEVVSVEELQQQEEQQEEQVDEDIVAQQVETTIFKFKVKCADKKTKYSKKK